MIVCICRRVSDKTLRTVIAEGAGSVEEVALACQAGTGCGACRPEIAEMIADSCVDCPRKRATVGSPYLSVALGGEKAA